MKLSTAAPLRYRLNAAPETLQEFELAAEERYLDALELFVAGRNGAGIYLMGYAAEMILKVAYFKLDGVKPGGDLKPRLGPAKTFVKRMHPGIDYESFHSLLFWIHAIRLKRLSKRSGSSKSVDVQALRKVRRLYQIWWVEMRYRRDRSTQSEVNTVYEDVTWLWDNRMQLWT